VKVQDKTQGDHLLTVKQGEREHKCCKTKPPREVLAYVIHFACNCLSTKGIDFSVVCLI
jgi:hypothetical protein